MLLKGLIEHQLYSDRSISYTIVKYNLHGINL